MAFKLSVITLVPVFITVMLFGVSNVYGASKKPKCTLNDTQLYLSNEFDWNLGKAIYKSDPNSNGLSTVNAKLSLGLLYLGADGKTAKEIEHVLHLKPDRNLETMKQFLNVRLSLKAALSGSDFGIGMKLFVHQSVNWNRNIILTLMTFFNSSLDTVDFEQKQNTVSAVNTWVKKETHDKINHLLTAENIDDGVLMLQVNAIYFKGIWVKRFPTESTKLDTFTVSTRVKVVAPFMEVVNIFKHHNDPGINCQIIRLPYVNHKVAMYIFLPNDQAGLSRVVEYLSPSIFHKTVTSMQPKNVLVKIPKFAIDCTITLGPIMKKLGLQEMFSQSADFSNFMSSNWTNIRLSNVVQKAVLEVDEHGNSYYDTSRWGPSMETAVPVAAKFTADHPFAFAIVDEEECQIVLFGTVVNPLQQQVKKIVSSEIMMKNAPNSQGRSISCDSRIENCDSTSTSNISTLSGGCVFPDTPLGRRCNINGCSGLSCELVADTLVPLFTSISCTCAQGYIQATMFQEVYCVKGGRWFPEIPHCDRSCKQLNPIDVELQCFYNDNEVKCNQDMRSGTRVRPSCLPAYMIRGGDESFREIYCQENGEWDDTLIKCVPECGIPYVPVADLIVGGHVTKYGETPWHVAIYDVTKNHNLICGGTIISPYLIVSAAHCFFDGERKVERNAADYEIMVSKYSREYTKRDNDDTQSYAIKKIYFPTKGYRGFQTNYVFDIAIMETVKKIILKSTVRTACMQWSRKERFNPPLGTVGKVSGFGVDDSGKETGSEILKTVELPYISYEKCIEIASIGFKQFITSDKFCAGNLTGSGVKSGDSGGGLLFQMQSLYYLAGVVSIKPSNDNISLAAFTDVFEHIEWISKINKDTERRNFI